MNLLNKLCGVAFGSVTRTLLALALAGVISIQAFLNTTLFSENAVLKAQITTIQMQLEQLERGVDQDWTAAQQAWEMTQLNHSAILDVLDFLSRK